MKKGLIFAILISIILISGAGCTKSDNIEISSDDAGVTESEVINNPTANKKTVEDCSKINEPIQLEHCIVNRALDAKDESMCANINENDFKEFFTTSEYYFKYSLDETNSDIDEIQKIEENRAHEIQQMKYTCYAVLAINLRDSSLCDKSGYIGDSNTGTDFIPRCKEIIGALHDTTQFKQVCNIYSGTLELARVDCS